MPSRESHIYCTANCRKRAWAHKHQQREDVPIEDAICWHCHCGFFRRLGGRQVYCSASCRTLASRAKREATIAAFVEYSMKSLREAADYAENRAGYAAMQAILKKRGLKYMPHRRQWVADVSRGG
jgi:hypothetical protein